MNSSTATSQASQTIVSTETIAREKISEAFLSLGFQWMSKDVLICNKSKLINYVEIVSFFRPSKEVWNAVKAAHIYIRVKCDICHTDCVPGYWYGTGENAKPLCNHCAGIELN